MKSFFSLISDLFETVGKILLETTFFGRFSAKSTDKENQKLFDYGWSEGNLVLLKLGQQLPQVSHLQNRTTLIHQKWNWLALKENLKFPTFSAQNSASYVFVLRWSVKLLEFCSASEIWNWLKLCRPKQTTTLINQGRMPNYSQKIICRFLLKTFEKLMQIWQHLVTFNLVPRGLQLTQNLHQFNDWFHTIRGKI